MKGTHFKNTAIYTIGNMAQKGLSFLLVFLYTHFISAEEIGMINTLQVFSAIYILFLSLGLERSLYRLYHDYKTENEKRDFLGTVNLSIGLISLGIVGITLLFKKPISSAFEDIPFSPFIILCILDAFFTVLFFVPKLLFQVRQQPIKFISITLGQGLANVLCITVTMLMGYRSAAAILTAGICSYLLFLPVIITVMVRNMNFVIRTDILKKTLKYSLPLVPSLMSSWVINMSDRIFIEQHYSGFREVGLYSVAYKIGQVVQLFATAMLMAYNPLFYSLANQAEPDRPKITKLHNDNIKALLTICFVAALFSNDFICIFLTPEYASTTHIVPIVIMGYFFIQMIGLQNLAFYQTKKTVYLMVISCIAAVINIGLNFLLIGKYGMEGAAFATMFTQMIFFVITYRISTKLYFLHIHFHSLLPLWLGAIAVVFFTFRYLEPGWIGFTIKFLVVAASLAALNYDKLKKLTPKTA